MASDNEIQVLSSHTKKSRNHLWVVLIVLLLLVIVPLCFQWKGKMKESDTYIDTALQAKVTTLLAEGLDKFWAHSGQVIVMETQTGEIKAMVGLQRNFDGTYISCDIFAYQQATGLMHPFSYMAALETRKVRMTDTVDTQSGIYVIDDIVIKDHNWHRGGYGLITHDLGFVVTSNISAYKAVQNAFPNRPQSYFDAIDSLRWGKVDKIEGIPHLKPQTCLTPKDSLWSSYNYPFTTIGYNQKIAVVQTLASYNAIANNGKMVKPKIYKGETEIVDDSIASMETIKTIQQAMRNSVVNGLGKPACSEKVEVAGKTGVIVVSDGDDESEGKMYTIYAAEFCGYFPVDKPRYTIIVSMNKRGLPVSGGLMAGSVFSEIVDYMMENSYKK